MPMHVKGVERTYTDIFTHNFLNIQQIFNLAKSFRKLRLFPTILSFNTIKYYLEL